MTSLDNNNCGKWTDDEEEQRNNNIDDENNKKKKKLTDAAKVDDVDKMHDLKFESMAELCDFEEHI